MSRGKTVVLLLVVLILGLSVPACGFTSQGPREQERPAENQSPATQDRTEEPLVNPAETMEETATEEATQ